MKLERDKFLPKFKEEADKQLLQISQQLVDLERDSQNLELINSIFRAAHTLKGNARMLNIIPVSNLAHEMETIFSEMRDGKLAMRPETTDLLFEALDILQSCVNASVTSGSTLPDTTLITDKLKKLLQVPLAATHVQSHNQRFSEEAHAQLLKISQLLVEMERSPGNSAILQELFRLAHTVKGNAAMLGYHSIKKVAYELEEIFAAARDNGLELQPNMLDTIFEGLEYIEHAVSNMPSDEDTGELAQKLHSLLGTTSELETEVPSTGFVQKISSPPANRLEAQTLSVHVNKLDDLMNISSEFVLSKMEAMSVLDKLRHIMELLRRKQRSGPLSRALITNNRVFSEIATLFELREELLDVKEIDNLIEGLLRSTFRVYEEHANHLQNTVDELERNVLSIRILPIGALFEEFRPFVRNLARSLGRGNPTLTVMGGEIEVDKKVLEDIRDPLLHLLSNALDHGIEFPLQRLAVGKPEEGHLTMEAAQEGSFVAIRISDDGSGINLDRIRERVIMKGLMSESRALNMSKEELIAIIYEPGFSTSAIITDVSGRGVGMDVVKKNVERLGGQVSILSEETKGTTFTLKVPLTIATSRALLVKIDSQVYAIPAPNIDSMLYLAPKDILTRVGRDVVLHRNILVPIIRLSELLGEFPNAKHPVFQWQQTAMQRNRNETAGKGLAVRGSYNSGDSSPKGAIAEAQIGLTLADPTASTRILMMNMESERRNPARFNFERMPAVVVGSSERYFCLLVDSLEDEVEIVIKSLGRLLKVPHVSSATILGDGRVVMILDVPNLVSTARVKITTTRSSLKLKEEKPRQKRILVVDDSITTRELEKSILEANGYLVDIADDGTRALEVLLVDNRYDLVISDIEMPHMNGFELTTNIKSNSKLRHLPVIIVSSLNNEEQKRKGIAVGAQAYITKSDFNQNSLLNTIEYLTD
ncbi:hybrid sensor histidine kinase/response regulator [Candidatus Chlorohelix sp.]|uniref:hybrid sensor histidine kinase/response regulator n=1 Tax=Candidatus Chlorohelix sp. TaxID=3139201 RepID=UPI003055377B